MSLNIELLETSFKAVTPKAGELADVFYENLLGGNPDLRPMFAHADMAEQKKKLVASLAMIVGNLRQPEALATAVEAMGVRHIDYGTRTEHYPLVGAALLNALARISGDAWNDELQQTWADAYQAVSDVMIQAADKAQHNA